MVGAGCAFVQKLKDFSSVLVELDFHQMNLALETPQIITYQDSCHLRNVMHTSLEPRQLLQSIKGTEFREMDKADSCADQREFITSWKLRCL